MLVRLALSLALSLAAPVAVAQNTTQTGIAPAVPSFSPERYMGTWYEIARLDHPFERGLQRVTSTRTPGPDGGFEVVNRGIDQATGQTREIRGKGRVAENTGVPTIAITYGDREHLYQVLELADDGSYALIGSTDRSALWIFSRTPRLDPTAVERLKARALSAGYPADKLMMVEQAP